MATSIQRVILIVFLVKFVVFALVNGAIAGQTYSPDIFEQAITDTDIENKRLQDYLLDTNPDLSGTTLQNEVGDSKLGFQFSAWGALKSGLFGVMDTTHPQDDIERNIAWILMLISTTITLLAGFELYQVVRGKTS